MRAWAAILALCGSMAWAEDGPIYGLAGGFIHEKACYVGSLAAEKPESIVKVAAGCFVGGMVDKHLVRTDWNTTDELLFRSFVVLQMADLAQTASALDSGEYAEGNPLYGKHPSTEKLVLGKALVIWGTYTVAQKMPRYRRAGLIVLTAGSALTVGHNASIGITVRF